MHFQRQRFCLSSAKYIFNDVYIFLVLFIRPDICLILESVVCFHLHKLCSAWIIVVFNYFYITLFAMEVQTNLIQSFNVILHIYVFFKNIECNFFFFFFICIHVPIHVSTIIEMSKLKTKWVVDCTNIVSGKYFLRLNRIFFYFG